MTVVADIVAWCLCTEQELWGLGSHQRNDCLEVVLWWELVDMHGADGKREGEWGGGGVALSFTLLWTWGFKLIHHIKSRRTSGQHHQSSGAV